MQFIAIDTITMVRHRSLKRKVLVQHIAIFVAGCTNVSPVATVPTGGACVEALAIAVLLMGNTASFIVQLDEAQMEVTAEHERSKAAESALEAQRRERRAAEYVCSRPASPHRDAALHAELANLRLQVPLNSMVCVCVRACVCAHVCARMHPTAKAHFCTDRDAVMYNDVPISGLRWTAAIYSNAKHGQILKRGICNMPESAECH